MGEALLDGSAQGIQRAGAGISRPAKDQFFDTARPDQLVVNQIGRETAHGQRATMLSDYFVRGGKADEMREAFDNDDVAVLHETADRLLHLHHLRFHLYSQFKPSKFAGWEGGKASARPRSGFAATQPCIDNSTPCKFAGWEGGKASARPRSG